MKTYKVTYIEKLIHTFYVEAENEEEAEEEAGQETVGTSISITPVSKVLQLSASSTYDDVLSVTNDGNEQIRFEVYAAPYSYVYSEESDSYALGFSKENNYTQN